MITITELKPPFKMPGLSSFRIDFPYNPQLVELVKSVHGACWHKTQKFWEIPASSLATALDALTMVADIELRLVPDTETSAISESPLTEDEIKSFKYKPFPHQVDAINYGLCHKDKWLLLDGMGLGKSLEMMYLAETLHNRGKLDHCMIICGVDSLRTNWKSEIQKFSNLDCIVLGEHITKNGTVRYKTVAERAEQLINPISEFFIIVNISTIRNDKIVEAFKKSKNKIGMICFDEAHRATKQSQQGDNLLKLKADYQVAASGTPITNSPLSAYLMLSWTDNDQSTLTNFKSTFCNFGGFGGKQIVGYRDLDLLKDELDSCSLRRTFDMVRADMPLKTVEYEIVEMSDEHRKFYEAIKDGVREEADLVDLHPGNLLALTTRLRQATAAPSVLTSNPIESSKVLRAVELAEDLLESGEKVVIFSTFVEPCTVLADKLARYNPLLATGEIPDPIVSDNISKFRNSDNFNLLIGTHGKLGTGFSMPECHYSIIIDTPWTDATLQQSIDRIYRITSDQPVFVKILCCANTIDERVKEIVENKRDLSDFLVDGKMSPGFMQLLKNIIFDI